MEKETNTYQQFNFQIALDKIEALTALNNELELTIESMNNKLKIVAGRMGV